MKQGSVRPSDFWRDPLISCLGYPLQASPSTGQRWLGGDSDGGRQAGSGKFHLGFSIPSYGGRLGVALTAASGALCSHRQMCNKSHVTVMHD